MRTPGAWPYSVLTMCGVLYTHGKQASKKRVALWAQGH